MYKKIINDIWAKIKKFYYRNEPLTLSFSNFGSLTRPSSKELKEAVNILDRNNVDFEFDGEMTPEVALDYDLIKENWLLSWEKRRTKSSHLSKIRFLV